MRGAGILILALAGCLEAPPAGGVPDVPDAAVGAGLVAHYAMDDDLSDEQATDSAGAHHGRCVGHCPNWDPTGFMAGTYAFSGTRQPTYLVVDDDSAFHVEAGTIAVWVRLATTESGAFLSKPFGTGVENSFGLFYLTDVGIYFETGNHPLRSGVAPVELDTWIHVAGTWDRPSGDLRLYIDGEEVASGVDFSIDFDDNQVLIGKERDDGVLGTSLDGKLDDLRLYGRALSVDEVLMLADGG